MRRPTLPSAGREGTGRLPCSPTPTQRQRGRATFSSGTAIRPGGRSMCLPASRCLARGWRHGHVAELCNLAACFARRLACHRAALPPSLCAYRESALSTGREVTVGCLGRDRTTIMSYPTITHSRRRCKSARNASDEKPRRSRRQVPPTTDCKTGACREQYATRTGAILQPE